MNLAISQACVCICYYIDTTMRPFYRTSTINYYNNYPSILTKRMIQAHDVVSVGTRLLREINSDNIMFGSQGGTQDGNAVS